MAFWWGHPTAPIHPNRIAVSPVSAAHTGPRPHSTSQASRSARQARENSGAHFVTDLGKWTMRYKAPAILSPRIQLLQAALQNRRAKTLQEFWDEIEQQGTPLIEVAADG